MMSAMAAAVEPDVDVAVVGAGFSGIGAAIAVQRAGIDRFVIVEEGDGVGGAWHFNRYPGLQVDIPSWSYQFSFRQRPDWSRVYAPGEELKAYAEDCVDHYGLRPKIRPRVSGRRRAGGCPWQRRQVQASPSGRPAVPGRDAYTSP